MNDQQAKDYMRRGGQARVAALTPDEHSALGTRGSDARWAAHRAELAAQGKKPRQTPAPMPPAALAYWKDVVKAEQPDRVWSSAMELKRAAIKRARAAGAIGCPSLQGGLSCMRDDGHTGPHRAEWI